MVWFMALQWLDGTKVLPKISDSSKQIKTNLNIQNTDDHLISLLILEKDFGFRTKHFGCECRPSTEVPQTKPTVMLILNFFTYLYYQRYL